MRRTLIGGGIALALLSTLAAFSAVAVATEPRPVGLPAPLTDDDFAPVDRAEAALGQLLFYDAILSGNQTVSCATCHHPRFATGDGVALGLGDGVSAWGPSGSRMPKTSPSNASRATPRRFSTSAPMR
jgi:cytochrome c peroxidase